MQPRTVADLGEFGLIARVATRLDCPPPPAGPGDDAAVVSAPDGRIVATTDLLVEGVHFRFDWSSPRDVGVKAAAANLADVAAMGARPTALLLGVALPGRTGLAVVDGLVDGLRDECARAGAAVVGGDTVSADRIMLAVTALGDLDGRPPVQRRTARPGMLVVAGRLGHSAAGLDLLRAGVDEFPELLAAHRRPQPEYAAGIALARAGATALCDISDGLVADLGHLLGDRLGADLALPDDALLRAAGERLGVDPAVWQATGGEDHGLLAVLPRGASVAGTTVLGTVSERPGIRGVPATAGRGGHDHFGR
ncbi:MAG TPA: thiamine-phosphate kinase [Mycobacteriales bacterium]